MDNATVTAWVPKEVREFIKKKGDEFYPAKRLSTISSDILIQWALQNGLEEQLDKEKLAEVKQNEVDALSEQLARKG